MTDNLTVLNGMNSCALFEDFSSSEKNQIAELALIRNFKADENIFTIQHKDAYFFLVHEGQLSLKLKTRKNKNYEKGQIFGEVSIFSDKYRSGNIVAKTDSVLIAFDSKKIFKEETLDAKTQFKLMQKLVEKITGYLYDDAAINSDILISKGESASIEFKRALNYKEKLFKFKLIQTLAAFMNTEGGTILIGVEDDGRIAGLNLPNDTIDEFIRNFVGLIKIKLGNYCSSLVTFDVEEVRKKKILRIDCDKSMNPIIYKDKDNEIFYIRTGTCNSNLRKLDDVMRYYSENFHH